MAVNPQHEILPEVRPPHLRRSQSAYLGRLEGRTRATGLPDAKTLGYAPNALSLAATAWTLKAEEEFRSAAVFLEIEGGLLESGAPLDLLMAINGVVRDEIEHAALCFDLADQFRAPAPRARLSSALTRLGQYPEARGQRALALLLFEGAIGETLSAMLFHAGRNAAREPRTQAALTMILRDEARHARLCWQAMGILMAEVDEAGRAFLQDDLRRSFGALEHGSILPVLQRLEANVDTNPQVFELGVIPPQLRIETFYRGLERVVMPRLAQLGLNGEEAWAKRYQ